MTLPKLLPSSHTLTLFRHYRKPTTNILARCVHQ
ncbi:hypothetical protein BVRB_6g146720 [Beta vulgaris subsp. vulgaris]|nr:hypothetical protein BVRB_6g146720 [Beta vulgaris subsp. vulgaris]